MKQVQSLGEQLGLSQQLPKADTPAAPAPQQQSSAVSGDMLKTLSRLAPLMNSANGDDDAAKLLHSLRPFLGTDRQQKLDRAEKMLKVIKIIPLLRENGLF